MADDSSNDDQSIESFDDKDCCRMCLDNCCFLPRDLLNIEGPFVYKNIIGNYQT